MLNLLIKMYVDFKVLGAKIIFILLFLFRKNSDGVEIFDGI